MASGRRSMGRMQILSVGAVCANRPIRTGPRRDRLRRPQSQARQVQGITLSRATSKIVPFRRNFMDSSKNQRVLVQKKERELFWVTHTLTKIHGSLLLGGFNF